MFGIERLRALHAVAVHGSVAAAAATLHVTPSGVSQQLAKLEREAGHVLLEPCGRGVQLTQAGRVLARHADVILTQIATAESDLDALREALIGPLRLGAIPTSVHALLPGALQLLASRHPRLTVILTEGEPEDTLPQVAHGTLDLAIIESWDNLPTSMPASTSRKPLLSDYADLAIPSTHRLAHRKLVDLSEVNDIPWVGWSVGSATYHWLTQTLRSQGLEPTISCTVAGYVTQLALVAGNLVAALVPRLARGAVPAGVSIVAIRPALHRTIYAVWRTGSASRAVQATVDVLQAVSTDTARRHRRPNQ